MDHPVLPHNPNAFPYSALAPGGPSIYADNVGMSLLDWFAGLMAAGMLAFGNTKDRDAGYISEKTYKIARAMLEERQKYAQRNQNG